jgi:UDP-GlcNAc:undecaprenyl-phosphate GlcNAc-1-phosphate transferase
MMTLVTITIAAVCSGALAAILSRLPTLTAVPMPDRWHTKATPITGGIAIFVGFLVSLQPALLNGAVDTRYLPVILGTAGAFVVGLVDDARRLAPKMKLLGQFAVAGAAVAGGLMPDWLPLWAGAPIALVVLVAAMNSINLLDHIDGLAAGTAAVASLALAAIAGLTGASGSSIVPAAIAGACIGYLPLNFRPRRSALIFMGDSGSHVLGFGLGGAALLAGGGGATSVVSAIAIPMLVLAVPVLDTTLVTVVRWAEGRPISQGGRDHSSHRLVYGGLGQQQAVLVLLGISMLCGGLAVALAVSRDPMLISIAAGVVFAALVGFGSRLALLSEGSVARVVPLRRGNHPIPEDHANARAH